MKTMRVLTAIGVVGALAGAALPAAAEVSAVTQILEKETYIEVAPHKLPTPPVHPALFTLPMNIVVVKDASITTNTPITDAVGSDYKTWAERVRECSMSKPILKRKVGDKELDFVVNGSEGKLKLNANDKPVCSI